MQRNVARLKINLISILPFSWAFLLFPLLIFHPPIFQEYLRQGINKVNLSEVSTNQKKQIVIYHYKDNELLISVIIT